MLYIMNDSWTNMILWTWLRLGGTNTSSGATWLVRTALILRNGQSGANSTSSSLKPNLRDQ